jgi:molybdate transport repressor ModE-like protein
MNPNDLDLRLLRSFLAVAQCGKVSTAAKQLHLSQPAVTAHLRRLEEIVGKPLLSRSTRGVRLTTQGHVLRSFSTEIQSTLSRIEASFRAEHKLNGDLRLGASLTIASHVIPTFLAEFSRVYPMVEIDLRVDNTEVVLESVRESFYPFGLVEGSPRAAGLRLEKFVEDEVVLVGGTNPTFRDYQRLAGSVATAEDLYNKSGRGRSRAQTGAADKAPRVSLRHGRYRGNQDRDDPLHGICLPVTLEREKRIGSRSASRCANLRSRGPTWVLLGTSQRRSGGPGRHIRPLLQRSSPETEVRVGFGSLNDR